MKNKLTVILLGTTLFSLTLGGIMSLTNKSIKKVDAIDKPTNINLNDTSEASIRNYYSYLNTLPESERRGTNLLKNLKYILVNNPNDTSKPARYFSYSQVREIYRITDRQWIASPASEISGYNPSTNTIEGFNGYSGDPYLYYYYRSDNFSNPHTATASVTSKEGKSQTLLNQEHLWSVSHGFKGNSANPAPNAGSDLHHLVAADVAGNKWGHSNYTYGYVDVEDSGWVTTRDNWDNNANAILNNKRGTALTTSPLDEETTVFEPQDVDKGDVARALFYMAARYNYYGDDSSLASQTEPDLEIIDYISDSNTTITCDGTNGTGKYGILRDLLEWHKNDPVTNVSNTGYYEIHRNNLIYENYQYTRNPFIDFPEWIDYVWGSKKDTGVASPLTDTVYGYNSSVKPTSITLSESSLTLLPGDIREITVSSVTPAGASKSVTWSSDNSNIVSVNSSGSIQAISQGNAVITATSTEDSNVKAYLYVTVSGVPVTGVTLNKITSSLEEGNNETLVATVAPSNASNKTVIWSTSDDSIATVDSNGVVTGVSSGSATIVATTVDGGYEASCAFTITGATEKYYSKITSTSSLTTGQYLVVCEYANIAMNGALSKTEMVKSGNNISVSEYIDTDKNRIESTSEIDAATFYYNSQDGSLKSSSGYYIGASSNSSSSLTASDDTPHALDISFDDDGNALMYSHTYTSTRIQVYSSSNFKFYASNQKHVQLYKKINQGGGGGEVIEKSYKRITSLSDVTTGNYVIASLKDTNYYAMSNIFPSSSDGIDGTQVSVSNDKISLQAANPFIVSLVVDGSNITISNSNSYLAYSGSSTGLVEQSEPYLWNISLNSVSASLGIFDITASSRHLAFAHGLATPAFKSYASINATYHSLELFKYHEETIKYTKTDFANDMMNSIICDSFGRSAPTFASGFSWSEFKTRYESLTKSDQTYLVEASANEFSEDVIERAMYRYDYIVSKYGSSEYEDFINRSPSIALVNKPTLLINEDNTLQIALIVVFVSLPMLFVPMVLHRSKNKEN